MIILDFWAFCSTICFGCINKCGSQKDHTCGTEEYLEYYTEKYEEYLNEHKQLNGTAHAGQD